MPIGAEKPLSALKQIEVIFMGYILTCDDGEQGIDVSKLNKQLNDLQFTEDEKQAILDELSHLSTAREKYDKFITLAKKKAEKKNDT